MTQATFTFRVDEDLKSAFAEMSKPQDRTAAQLLRSLMREAVRRQREGPEHGALSRGEVEQALREADDPAVRRIPYDRVQSSWRQQRTELIKRGR